MNAFSILASTPASGHLASSLRETISPIVRERGAVRPYSMVRILKTPFADDHLFLVADNTSFHSLVVTKIAVDARAVGAIVATEVQLRPVQGGFGPRVDLILQLSGQPLTFMDVKTGDRPRNTAYQEAWYPTIPLEWHLTTDDPRIEQFGIVPGEPFPPSLFEYWTQRDANSDAEIYRWRPRR